MENRNRRFFRGSRFYPLLAFVAWLIAGFASVRWPVSLLAKSFDALTLLLGVMLQQAFGRSQDYYNRISKRDSKDSTEAK